MIPSRGWLLRFGGGMILAAILCASLTNFLWLQAGMPWNHGMTPFVIVAWLCAAGMTIIGTEAVRRGFRRNDPRREYEAYRRRRRKRLA